MINLNTSKVSKVSSSFQRRNTRNVNQVEIRGVGEKLRPPTLIHAS